MNDFRLEKPYVDEPGCIMVISIKVKECLMYCESSEYMCSLCIILSIRQFEKAVFRILIYRLIYRLDLKRISISLTEYMSFSICN